jgi:FkbM family methyltransferase
MTVSELLPEGYGPSWQNQSVRLHNLRSLGFRPRTFLDVGAHHGHFSSLIQHVFPGIDIFMIDGEEDCREHLLKKPFPFEIALLAETEREANYHRCTSGCTEGNGLYKENGVAPFETVKRQTKTLDSIVGDRTFDFIKMDCQGGELNVLVGGRRTVSRAYAIQLETQIQDYNEGAPRLIEVMMAMAQAGFRVYDIADMHYNALGMLLQVDVLFLRQDSPLFRIRPLS